MKLLRKYCFATLLSVLLVGCHKDSVDPLLTGTWLWEATSGGFGGAIIKSRPNERAVLQFSDNGQFSLHQNDTLVFSGAYGLTKETSIYSGKEAIKIELRNITNSNQVKNRSFVVMQGVISTLTASQLSIGDNFYDGYGSSFVRK